jgi:hypothetical protein
MIQAWSMVESLDTAAAFRSLGIPVMSDKTLDLARGKDWHRWSVCRGINLPGTDVPADPLIRAVRHNELEKIDPCHPILDSLGVLKIRHQLIDAMHNGTSYRINLAVKPGAVLEVGHEPSLVQTPPHVETGDLKLSACLIRLGLPIAKITGTPPMARITLATPGYGLHPQKAIKGEILVAAFRQLPRHTWAHVAPQLDGLRLTATLARLRHLMHTLWIRDQLHDYIQGRRQQVILTAPHTRRHVLMPDDASGGMMDRVAKFMGVP